MNTMTLSESTAVATAVTSTSTVAASQERRFVPLSLLRPSSRNVRRSGGTSIPELAASIARVGLRSCRVPMASASTWWPVGVASRRSSCW